MVTVTSPHQFSGAPGDGPRSAAEVVVPIVVESADIRKVEEHVGTVRIRKITQLEEVTVDALETRDVVETKHVPIGMPVDSAKSAHYQGDVWVVPVYEERLVKQLFLVEELHVSKRRDVLGREQKLTLRREVLVTERFDATTQQWVVDPPCVGDADCLDLEG